MTVRTLEVNHGIIAPAGAATVFIVPVDKTLIVKQVMFANAGATAQSVYLSRSAGADASLLWTGSVPTGGITAIAGVLVLEGWQLVINPGDTLFLGSTTDGPVHWHVSGALLDGTAL